MRITPSITANWLIWACFIAFAVTFVTGWTYMLYDPKQKHMKIIYYVISWVFMVTGIITAYLFRA